MKLLLLACFVAFACADVSHIVPKDESKAQIVEQALDLNPEGSYQWSLKTDNGISIDAQGNVVQPRSADEPASQSVQGQASWTAPDGQSVSFQYTADENGYQPQGSHLPTPPPIPEAILRALEYIRTHAPAPEKK